MSEKHKSHRKKYLDHLVLSAIVLLFLGGLAFAFSRKEYHIINIHEHIESQAEAAIWLQVMRKTGIKQTVLLGTPLQTITLRESDGFRHYDENNSEILELARRNSEHFIAFCTINPLDGEKLQKLQDCVAKGARGLKLYSGHGLFHNVPLDDPGMLPIYEYAEQTHLPIVFHVNINKYEREFRRVLEKFPNLIVNCPHFCLTSLNQGRLTSLFDKYPNFYTDISFGYYTFMGDGFWRISQTIEGFREMVEKYPNRFLFGADIVVTMTKVKSSEWQKEMPEYVRCYRDVLEKEAYTCPPLNEYLRKNKKGFSNDNVLHGLGLSREILEKIYWENPRRFLGLE